jgi:hypothetical protein
MMPARKRVVSTKSIPAPVGGLNARDAIANMPETDAIIMDNWFPETASVRVRSGYSNWSAGLPGAVETLMTYSNGFGRKLFGIASNAFYDCTNAGPVGAPLVTAQTNSRWQYANFGTLGGQYLYAVNGVDYPQIYDGTAWQQVTGLSTPFAITGIDPRKFSNVSVHKSRLWFVEKNSFRAWYLDSSSVGGAAHQFDISPLFKLGGYLSQIINWTVDRGISIADYTVFVSSEGEIALYVGADPASASTFALSGLFRIGRPIGNRFNTKFGSDQVLICMDGFFPLSKAVQSDRSQIQGAVSDKIIQLANNDIAAYSSNFGWQIILHPIGNKLIANVPGNGKTYQYVMNTITGAWCRFTGWNASCFETYGDKLMFGGNGYVAWCDQGSLDDTLPIISDLKPAFSYFGSKVSKQFTMVRPLMQVDAQLDLRIDLNTDFQDVPPRSTPNISGAQGSAWGATGWNVSAWQAGATLRSNWQSVLGIGFAGTLRMRCITKNQTTSLQSIDYVFQQGGIL